MITDPFESGKKAGERSASDYDQRAKSIYEIEIHGRKRIETIYSRLKPRFDDIAFHIYNTGTSIMISTPLGEGYPELSIAIEGEYVGGRYVHNSDRYLVRWDENSITGGLRERREESTSDNERVLEIAGIFYGNWARVYGHKPPSAPAKGGAKNMQSSGTKKANPTAIAVLIASILIISAYLWFF